MFCSTCGRSVREFERYCSVCGNKINESFVSENLASTTKGISSFEDIVSARVREARKSKLVDKDLSNVRSKNLSYPEMGLGDMRKNGSGQKSPFFFVRITFFVGIFLMILGYFIFPFAYVLYDTGTSLRKFEWRLHAIASLLSDRADEEYVFGPALAFLVGGHLWTMLFALVITVVTYFGLRTIDEDSDKYDEKRKTRSDLAVVLGRVSIVLMVLIFTWQLTGMLTLQRAADVRGGLSGGQSVSYFSLGLGSVMSLLGIAAFIFGGANLVNRGLAERNSK